MYVSQIHADVFIVAPQLCLEGKNIYRVMVYLH